jgi:RHH-type rel operon transcriptional repressor/antitoxin RelB
MTKHSVSVRIEAEKCQALDELAGALDRDRSWVINAALDSYLELHHWQAEHIRAGLAEVEQGSIGIGHDEVMAAQEQRVRERLASRR